MRFLDALVPPTPPRAEATRYVPPGWMQPYFDGAPGPLDALVTTYGRQRVEPVPDTFISYVINGLCGNAAVAAVERVRLAVFSEARLQFQQMRKGRPADLFGDAVLAIIERPWPGGTTGDLLVRALMHADFAGNSFTVEIDGELVQLRPDWVEIVLAKRAGPGGMQVGWRRVGYLYYEGGKVAGADPEVFLAGEVAHFAPLPDPLATYRGMSWLTPIIRDMQSDTMATKHKMKFWENAASPNVAVKFPQEISAEEFDKFADKMDERHSGPENAGKTLYVGAGADVTVIGANMQQMDFKAVTGAGEVRIAAAGGVHPAIAGLSEGLAGSSLNAGNFGAARRLVADVTARPLWRNFAGSFEVLIPPPSGARLWYDDRDVAFLREDATDAAKIAQIEASTIGQLVRDGFTPESARAAVLAKNMDLLVPIEGWISVQLQQMQKQAAGTVPNGQPPNGRPVLAGA